ncbi:hypothetical protein I553_3001 [Mycobacterium xenopi 4042]|uniref:Uncharacterized protein n=1 Tax=Mycobacterium xenopi 4042 TaxID=1299334 RepID=X8EFT7_MYCXE|nr:hypothetical protein I553_3001 [Mycobacterium xenopi 4042]
MSSSKQVCGPRLSSMSCAQCAGGYLAAAPEAVGIGNGSRCPTVRRAVSQVRHVPV